jgi:cytochrome oxidase assembly protein ShyY1
MPKIKASPRKSGQEDHPYLTSLVALGLIALCLWASQWQFQRGVDRHHRNSIIEANVNQPIIELGSAMTDIKKHEWQLVRAQGNFDPATQILLRNKYFEGKYGFNLLTLFTDSSGLRFWINRGWIAPGENAKTAPDIPSIPTSVMTITGRLRLDESLPQGSFFAMPTKSGGNLVEEWNAQSKSSNSTEVFYIDLVKTSDPRATPTVPVELPELSDGPHMAYALQWLFFAGLVIYGRLLLRRTS